MFDRPGSGECDRDDDCGDSGQCSSDSGDPDGDLVVVTRAILPPLRASRKTCSVVKFLKIEQI